MREKGDLDPIELDLLLRNRQETHAGCPVDFLNDKTWSSIKALSLVPNFHGLDRDIETSSKRWKKYVESEAPEQEKPPVNLEHRVMRCHSHRFFFFFRANGKANQRCNNCVFFELFDLIE